MLVNRFAIAIIFFSSLSAPAYAEALQDALPSAKVGQDAAALLSDDPVIHFAARDRALMADAATREALLAELEAAHTTSRAKTVARVLRVRADDPEVAKAFDEKMRHSAANPSPMLTRGGELVYNVPWERTYLNCSIPL